MGWSSGSRLMAEIVTAIRWHLPYKTRVVIYKKIIVAFEDMDWDTQEECLGLDRAFDEAIDKLHPKWKEGRR